MGGAWGCGAARPCPWDLVEGVTAKQRIWVWRGWRSRLDPLPPPQAAQPPPRRVKQLQFTTWPDHSVPEAPSSLLAFMELVREQAREAQGTGPILVHCR